MDRQERLSDAAVDLLEKWPLFDNTILRHGFAPYIRDYILEVSAAAAAPEGTHSYVEGQYRFVFTHCVIAEVSTSISSDAWNISWDDLFTDYDTWEEAGAPSGYVFGVESMDAYPGAEYRLESQLARDWSDRLRHPMHEVTIQTNAHNLRLIFHSLRCYKIAHGDPESGVVAIEHPIDLLANAT